MDGATVLEVAAKADGNMVKATQLTLDGKEVGKRLGGVVVTAVARVDHGNGRVAGGHEGRTLLEVAHRDYVSVAADDLGGVRHALPLGRGGRARVGKAQHLAAKLVHRGLEGQTRTGGRLEKQGGKLFAVAGLGVLAGVRDDVLGNLYKLVNFCNRKLLNIN